MLLQIAKISIPSGISSEFIISKCVPTREKWVHWAKPAKKTHLGQAVDGSCKNVLFCGLMMIFPKETVKLLKHIQIKKGQYNLNIEKKPEWREVEKHQCMLPAICRSTTSTESSVMTHWVAKEYHDQKAHPWCEVAKIDVKLDAHAICSLRWGQSRSL